MRYAAKAGQFYSGTPEALIKEIEGCFTHPLGPGRVPKVNKPGASHIRGLVSPHAGFVYSGPVAAHGFSALAEDGIPDVFVIIGPNHHGVGSGVAVTTHDFETPLGVMRNDRELSQAICRGIVEDSILAHRHEHSIEVQIPFIQYLFPDSRIVPVSMMAQDHRSAAELGQAIRDASAGRNVVIIASTDFSHYISPERARELDNMAIDRILALDSRGLYDTVRKNRISMCGFGPVMAMMEAAKGTEAELLKYANSGDIRPMPEVVGYASIAIR